MAEQETTPGMRDDASGTQTTPDQQSSSRTQDESTPQVIQADQTAGTLPVPTRGQLDEMAETSDQSELSQQELETGNDTLDAGTTAQAQGHISTPTGLRQDEADAQGFTADDDILRADMVSGGD